MAMAKRRTMRGTQVLLIATAIAALQVSAIPTAPPISPNNPKYESYMDVVNLLKRTIKPEVNPCDDFYQYTCGNFNSSMWTSFDAAAVDNFNRMTNQLQKDYYLAVSPLPVKQAGWFFQSCVSALSNWNNIIGNGEHVRDILNDVMKFGVPFPMVQQKSLNSMPTPTQLATLLGYIAGEYGIWTLLTLYVDTNWKDPHSENGYVLFIDQPSTTYSNAYYRKGWDLIKDEMVNDVINNMIIVQSLYGKSTNLDRLRVDAMDIVDFEYALATEFSTDDNVRRKYARSYNPMNRRQAQDKYSFINWRTFIAYALSPGGDEVYMKVASNPDYNYIFKEPIMLSRFQDAITSGRWSPNTIVNYIYYNLIASNAEFLPRTNPIKSDSHAYKTYTIRPLVGMPRYIRAEERMFKREHFSNKKDLQLSCAAENVQMMQYANARVFIDNVYPNLDDRASIRHSVGNFVEFILNGMRSMIDQLSWMSRSTKQEAYAKIDNLVKNIAYPNWITDDDKLSNFHSSLTIQPTDDYLTMLKKANFFNLQTSYRYLIKSTGSDRTDFNGAPGTVNAWYQPETNSITFPAGIIRKPFFDPNWPAAFNFGSFGVAAGHEITHGFDDEGVQWDGTGALNEWMDVHSNYYFEEMADCVINEYSNFCPLPSNYSEAACIDGVQTQGENIADNGGIRSAFRAYKNYINLNGPDPLLPDDVLGQITSDQLFFLGFAQVWCEMPPSLTDEFRQILSDVHSPSLYRVFGTIQNFPAFKSAFNCPYSSKYSPAKHCNVWVSDLEIKSGIPQIKNDLNIVAPEKIEPRNMTIYNAYEEAVDFFTQSVDFSQDPCNDFYKYSCGKYNKPVSFDVADEKNKNSMAAQLLNPNYAPTIQNSTALTKTLQFFTQCKIAASTMNEDLKKKNLVAPKLAALQAAIGTSFPGLEHQITPLNTMPTAKQLASALSLLSFKFAVDTIITPMVDTNWITPSAGYYLHVDQNTAFWSKSYYQNGAWNITYSTYLTLAKNVMNNYAQSQGKSLNQTLLTRDLSDVFEFERLLATKYSTDDTTRRQYLRSWNPTKISDLNSKYSFIDWPTFFNFVPGFTIPTDYSVNILETAQFTALSKDFSVIVKPTVLVNFLNIRLLLSYSNLIPTYGTSQRVNKEWKGLGRGRRQAGQRVVIPQIDAVTVSDTDVSCAGATLDLLPFANGRVFIDYTYPTQAAKDTIRKAVGGVISNILQAFQSMLDGLDWMDDYSKVGAYDKIRKIQKNVAYPDWIMDNGKLDAFYANLKITSNDDYYAILDALTSFNLYIQYNQLNKKSTDRSDFLGQPGIVNAWYQPELNSITFPAGILRPPYFDPNWPASLNYGGMGLVAGHELTHGFDDEGVQWDGLGALNKWMTSNSTAGFSDMAQCVIDEYSSFCPLKDTKYYPQCLNGENTQGENIADNGGIHSAFRAYRTHIALNGPDPTLNHRVFEQFTHDQLFFLNFGQVWCEAQESPDSYFKQIMVDPHSPANYRVFGAIQNFPAFRTAFNCPVGTAYAPKDHCHVWVPQKSP